MLKKVLIANRGEIACRIVATARRMGIGTVAVYADADAGALHVAMADQAVHIGASPATESYLVIDRIIAAARHTGADAIHPGYGFLSENADFADAVAAAGLVFIGPTGDAMRALGGKAAAKEIAIKAGVPVVPGYQGGKQDVRTLAKEAKRIGYPVMIKAVAGGGGRGMRLVEREADLASLLDSAQREAKSAFGNADVLVEKVVQRPRHVEVQVFGDSHGNVVHLFERDCSLQRRNQKVIEEAPAPGMSQALRVKMCEAAVKLAKSVGYRGAGTVEFLVEGGALSADAPWYFIEMNTRLQVEHPVTEEITGLDLVEWQFRVAAGEPLPLQQSAIRMHGHAIEVRLCAEDPANGFMPSVGEVVLFRLASEGVRVESSLRRDDAASGCRGPAEAVSPFYDSMIAKIIAHGEDRAAAIAKLRTALGRSVVFGVATNTAFLAALLADADVARGDMDTGLIARKLAVLTSARVSDAALAQGVRHLIAGRVPANSNAAAASPWDAGDAFQFGSPREIEIVIDVDGAERRFLAAWGNGVAAPPSIRAHGQAGETLLASSEHSPVASMRRGGRCYVSSNLVQAVLQFPVYDAAAIDDGDGSGAVRAPINGRLVKLFVAQGEQVERGQRIAVVEAMKMEHVVIAAIAGSVERIAVAEGVQVTLGTLIVSIVE